MHWGPKKWYLIYGLFRSEQFVLAGRDWGFKNMSHRLQRPTGTVYCPLNGGGFVRQAHNDLAELEPHFHESECWKKMSARTENILYFWGSGRKTNVYTFQTELSVNLSKCKGSSDEKQLSFCFLFWRNSLPQVYETPWPPHPSFHWRWCLIYI